MNQNLVESRKATSTMEREIAKNIFLVAPGVWRMKDVFVNVFIIQNNHSSNWILVDTGLKSSAMKIKKMIAEVLDPGASPMAIILTHGHFDHRGSVKQLAEEWQVLVYAHHLERPFLTGKCSYPPPDPTVGGGAMSSLAFLYPKAPINISDHLIELPENGSIPGIPEWKWIHTPGHTPGHISLFRESDGVLITGDALATTNAESAFSILTQKKGVNGPPKYLTTDWGAAARSVKELAILEPAVVASGHGVAMYGEEARKGLHKLAKQFWKCALPASGRYVKEPALFNEEGVTYLPPLANKQFVIKLIGAAAFITVGVLLYKSKQKKLGKVFIGASLKLLTGSLSKMTATI